MVAFMNTTQTIFDPNDKLLSIGEVQRILRISKSRIYTLISLGEFMPPIKIGRVKSFWLTSEVIAYAQSRLDERNVKQRNLKIVGGTT